LYTEDLSRRDSVKVAQYEVLGNDAKRQVRPVRDDRIAWRLVSHAGQRLPHRSIVPSGTDSSLKTLTQSAAADTGLLREVPAGPIFSNRQQRS
jgi:hypothetical protein